MKLYFNKVRVIKKILKHKLDCVQGFQCKNDLTPVAAHVSPHL